jgi:hypothetical protein
VTPNFLSWKHPSRAHTPLCFSVPVVPVLVSKYVTEHLGAHLAISLASIVDRRSTRCSMCRTLCVAPVASFNSPQRTMIVMVGHCKKISIRTSLVSCNFGRIGRSCTIEDCLTCPLIGEFRLAGFRRVLGANLREVLMPKRHRKTPVLKLLRMRYAFFCLTCIFFGSKRIMGG